MTQSCKHCQQSFTITQDDLNKIAHLSPTIAGIKLTLPPPKLCPECRKQRRATYRNERKLYHRKCNHCQKEIISVYAPEKPYNVFCLTCWWDDKHNPADYGQEFDFSRPFFAQYDELLKKVPLPALISSPDAEENNCSYINYAGNSKNCYMTFDADFNEDSYYSNILKHSKNCMECSSLQESELCYETLISTGCYHTFFSQELTNCQDCYFLKNCIGCRNCLLCVNLNHKEYCIMNKQYTKEQYLEYMSKIDLGDRKTIQALEQELEKLAASAPHKFIHGVNLENCTGDYMVNAKNCQNCFMVGNVEDLTYCDSLYRAKDCMDVSSFGEQLERAYETVSSGINAYELQFCQVCATNTYNLQYNYGSRNSKNSFGSVALKSNEYCILNKQYTKDTYEKLVSKIVEHMKSTGEWGEYFPMSISPYAYNETVANEFFPLSKEQALKLDATWKEEDLMNRYEGPKVVVPENIKDVSEQVLKQILTCDKCGKNYKLIAQELKFYQEQKLPLPIWCFNCRHEKRMSKRNPQHLWDRNCSQCNTSLKTSYSPNRPEKIYCEPCYQKLVF
ncbi:MAG: hypothetical protein HY817_04235 [Candidatus Abawacabacteria bacterium]|nr:hypothetical protein [Candidatus Abawacabacteria bacterium]